MRAVAEKNVAQTREVYERSKDALEVLTSASELNEPDFVSIVAIQATSLGVSWGARRPIVGI